MVNSVATAPGVILPWQVQVLDLPLCRYVIVMIAILSSFDFKKNCLFQAMSFYKQFPTSKAKRRDVQIIVLPREPRLNQFTN